jgi:serine/threonine protein kinase
MGKVYLAYTPGGRAVAVKVIRPELAEDPEFRQRFRQEVAAAGSVHGAFTAELVDADTDGPLPWLATRYIPGASLQQAVTGHGPLPAHTVWQLFATAIPRGARAVGATTIATPSADSVIHGVDLAG